MRRFLRIFPVFAFAASMANAFPPVPSDEEIAAKAEKAYYISIGGYGSDVRDGADHQSNYVGDARVGANIPSGSLELRVIHTLSQRNKSKKTRNIVSVNYIPTVDVTETTSLYGIVGVNMLHTSTGANDFGKNIGAGVKVKLDENGNYEAFVDYTAFFHSKTPGPTHMVAAGVSFRF